MTDKFKGWYPDYIENEKEREPILKLAKMMTGRAKKKLGLEKMTKYDPEYWGLALLCTDEQAEIALKMGVRQPKTLDQMVKVTGKDRDYLEKQLEEMAEVALVEYNWENPQHEKQYVLPIFVPGSAEFSCMNAKMLEKHPELGLFFERMSRTEHRLLSDLPHGHQVCHKNGLRPSRSYPVLFLRTVPKHNG